jgi:hypothetical protein
VTTKKGYTTIAEFIGKMKALGDHMVTTGRPLGEEEFVEYILKGLDADVNPIISALIAGKETITISKAYQKLLAFETHMDMLSISNSGFSTNTRSTMVDVAMVLAAATTMITVVVAAMSNGGGHG